MISSQKTAFLSILLAISVGSWISQAQSQITLQIPTIDIFELRTIVAVPDGGTLRLGGVQHSALPVGLRFWCVEKVECVCWHDQ